MTGARKVWWVLLLLYNSAATENGGRSPEGPHSDGEVMRTHGLHLASIGLQLQVSPRVMLQYHARQSVLCTSA